MLKKSHTRYFHIKYLHENLEGIKGMVLDVGCGDGWVLNEIKNKQSLGVKAGKNLKLYGCDIKKNIKFKFNFKISSAEKLKYKNGYFDFVIMTDVLEHLENPGKAISEIARILKQKGKFHLVVPLEGEPFTIDGIIKRIFNKNQKREPIGHIQQFKLEIIKKLLENNNFKIIKIRYSYHFLYQLISFIYFTKINLVDNGKYKPLNYNQFFIDFVGLFVNFEDYLLSKFKGQEAHILTIKK